MNVSQAIRAATAELTTSDDPFQRDTARRDAEYLMAHAMGCTRNEVLLRRMSDPAPDGFAALVARRAAHEPVAYITGQASFWGLDLDVSPAVLIPRGDSETLIEAAQQAFAAWAPTRVLDLGTGSGCLLLAALSLWPAAEGIGIERSDAARAIATANVARHAPAARILDGDWTRAGWAAGLGRFDLILANPPYVETGAALDPDVRDHEPASALFAGREGLDDYRRLVPQLPGLLAPGGVAVVEIGHTQANAVTQIGAAAGLVARMYRDLAGRPRALAFRWETAGQQ